MELQAIHDTLKAAGVAGLLGCDEPRPANKKEKDPGRAGMPFLLVDPAEIVPLLTACRDESRLQFDLLIDLTASDPAADGDDLWVLIQLLSLKYRHRLAIKAHLPKSALSIASATAVYRAANWHERECSEMFGITFEGHPDPRKILLPDDWKGFPLRKDYEFPTEYHGISCE
jgi:NADH-quinone oxidoreductase subunit C